MSARRVPDNDGKTNGGQQERQRGSPMGNATKRKAQSRAPWLCIVRHCGFTLFLPHPLSSRSLARSRRLIRKFRGKETKEGGRAGRGEDRERRRLGVSLLHYSKRSPSPTPPAPSPPPAPRDETPHYVTAKHPNANFWQRAKCRSVSREIINDRASFLGRELMRAWLSRSSSVIYELCVYDASRAAEIAISCETSYARRLAIREVQIYSRHGTSADCRTFCL